MRRFELPGAGRRRTTGDPGTRPADELSSPATVLGLQRRAGNTAVRGLIASRLAVQRAPFTSVPAAAPQSAAAATDDLQKRLDEAKKAIGTAGWFPKAVTELYAAKPRPVDELVKAILSGHLRLPELAEGSGSVDPKLKPAADRLIGAVKGGVPNGLNATMTAIAAALPARAAELEPYVTPKMQNKLWAFDELLADVWDNWLQCTPFAEVVKVAFEAKKAKDQLAKILAIAVREYASKHFTGAALAALSGPPREAAKSWIEPRTTWVTAPPDLDILTDHVLGATKVTYKDRTDQVWKDMRAKVPDYVVCAETDLIKAQIDKNWTGGTTEEVWSRARGMYVGTMEKPVWRFYTDDIVGFTLFGHSAGKASGVHQNVVAELARVEASAKRLAGAAWSTTKLPAGFSFRFQPQDGDFAGNAHVSLHATGRAVDFDAMHNPFSSGAAKNLVGALGGVDFDAPGGMPGFGELQKLAEDITAKYATKAALEAKLKGQLEDEEKGSTEQQLADVNAQIAALPARADVVSIRDRAGHTYDDLVTAQTEFLKVWQELTGGGKAKDIDPAKVLERLTPVRVKAAGELVPVDTKLKELTEQIDKLKAQSGELKKQGKAADPTTVADVKTRLTKAQSDLDPLRTEKKRIEERIKQLTDLEKRFGGKATEGKALMTELQNSLVAGGGFTNMPRWLPQAFAENGFTWGGGWHAPEDAMHYSSMTPIPGVAQPGMG